jgi:transcriptional regulator with XRE-family HTH domain
MRDDARMASQRPSPLRTKRLLRGLRLRDLERATEIPETTLSRLERGESPLVGHWLTSLAAFYEVEPRILREEMAAFLDRLGPEHVV